MTKVRPIRMQCRCGEWMIGDGYTRVIHCPYAEDTDSHEPDANPVHCDFEEAAYPICE